MKAKISKLKLLSAIVATCFVTQSFAQLGGLKNAAKNAATKTLESKPKEEKKEVKKEEKTETKKAETTTKSETPANVKMESSESGYDLAQKGDKEFEAERYKEALAYYEEAEKRGHQDGMTKKRMRECREMLDPAVQEENKKAFDFANLKMGELDAMKYKIEPVQDNGMTNDFHKANVGKIVFAKAEIPKAETSGANFSNTFNLGDDIYSRVYLEKSFTNEAYAIGYIPQFTDFAYRMTVDGQDFSTLYQTRIDKSGVQDKELLDGPWGYPRSKVAEDPATKDKWTTFQIAISPTATDAKGYPTSEFRDFFYRMYQLPAGSHKVKLEVVFDIPKDEVNKGSYGTDPDQGRKWTTKFGKEKVLAVGEFTVNVTEAGKIAAGKKICPDLSWLSGTAKLVPDGLNMINKSKRDGETILKLVEFGNDWTYHRNVYGVILRRTLEAKALAQDAKTKLCYVINISYEQQNTSSGGATYGPTSFSRSGSVDNVSSEGVFVRECTGK